MWIIGIILYIAFCYWVSYKMMEVDTFGQSDKDHIKLRIAYGIVAPILFIIAFFTKFVARPWD